MTARNRSSPLGCCWDDGVVAVEVEVAPNGVEGVAADDKFGELVVVFDACVAEVSDGATKRES